jgi:hypothetical protein
MLATPPRWTHSSKQPLTQWYGHVQLLPKHVLGQWACLERSTGQLLWARRLGRPNTVRGVGADVIVASEMRSDGPWTADFGVYGIDLETGKLLWTSHANGLWGRLVRGLDAVPMFTNELRDRPALVRATDCVTERGRVLDLKTGKRIGKEFSPAPQHDVSKHLARALYMEGSCALEWGTLRLGSPEAPRAVEVNGRKQVQFSRGVLRLFLQTGSGQIPWTFTLEEHGCHCASNYFSYRLATPFVYVLVSDRPDHVPDPRRGTPYVVPNAGRYQLWTIDARTGRIEQRVAITDSEQTRCRLEDVDEQALLVSAEDQLLCFERTA